MKATKEKPLLVSQFSISYWTFIIIITFVLGFISISLFKSDENNFTIYGAVALACTIFFFVYMIYQSKVIRFYDTYLKIEYLNKKILIKYSEIIEMEIEYNRINLPSLGKSDMDVIVLPTKDGKVNKISRFQFDNYFNMRVFLRTMIGRHREE